MTVPSLLLVLAPLAPALASVASEPDRTGIGGGPRSTPTGVTEPPVIGEDPEGPSDRRMPQRIACEDDRIGSGIRAGYGRR